MIRVLIADDHPAVRAGLARELAGAPDMEVVGQAADGEEALRLLEEYPIAPGEAFGRLLFPIVNTWGVWNVFAALADCLKREGSALAHLGTSLRSWLLWLYVAWGVVVGKLSTNESLSRSFEL